MNRLNLFSGEKKPSWSPSSTVVAKEPLTKKTYLTPKSQSPPYCEFYYVLDSVMDSKECNSLINQFDLQALQPVGVDGYGEVLANGIGSYRANAWAPELSDQLTTVIKRALSDDLHFSPTSKLDDCLFTNSINQKVWWPLKQNDYRFFGCTPFMRFMKYPSGGRHVPHYDAPFKNSDLHYTTIMSWVLYLNTPKGTGGSFQFVDDGQWDQSPSLRNRSDWTRMAEGNEIIDAISPTEGRLLILPHWLCHQVEMYQSPSQHWRYIIRGDLAYEW